MSAHLIGLYELGPLMECRSTPGALGVISLTEHLVLTSDNKIIPKLIINWRERERER